MTRIRLAASLAILALASPAQDLLQLKDGRFVQHDGVKMTRTPEGVKVHFTNGDVLVKKDLVREASVSRTEGAEEPPAPGAAEKEAQGLVRFEGKWIKREMRDKLVEDGRKARAQRIKDAMAHREWRNRYRMQTANFEFEYTIEPDVMKDLAPLIEAYYRTFLDQWKITRPAKLGRAKVCFYHDHPTYRQVSGSPIFWAGYFRRGGSGELNFYYDRNDRDWTTIVMLHETNHYLTYLIDTEFWYPIWVNESLAEYYSASEWNPATKTMTTGRLQEGRLASIQDQILSGKWQDLEEIIRTPQASFTADFYAWGWSFVHYLLESKKYAQKFKAFYVGLARDKSLRTKPLGVGPLQLRTVEPDEAIRYLLQSLGVKDLKTLEKEWHEHVKGMSPSSARGYAQAADTYFAYDMPIKAKRFYETAIEKGDQRPVVWYGLARVLERKDESEKAEQAYRKAIEGDPLNGLAYAGLASAIKSRTRDPKSLEAARLNALALEVDPENLELWQRLWLDDEIRKSLEGLSPESKPAK